MGKVFEGALKPLRELKTKTENQNQKQKTGGKNNEEKRNEGNYEGVGSKKSEG